MQSGSKRKSGPPVEQGGPKDSLKERKDGLRYQDNKRINREEAQGLSLEFVFAPFSLDLGRAFSCICFFESGRFKVHANSLINVMAMCSTHLIWVASRLVEDPVADCESNSITVFPGNIGRSGIALLIPPASPMIKPSNFSDFRDVIHRPFEGQLHNNFRSTSLHLSFTTAESALGQDFSGMKDDELFFLETLLSVHDAGEWIADLDVLKSFSTPYCKMLKLCEQHPEPHIGDLEVSCIDNWNELLVPPETGLGIVRACGDWQARLAAFTIGRSLGNMIFLSSDNICWSCLREQTALSQEVDHEKNIIVIA